MEVYILGARGFFCAVSGVSCLYCDPRCDRRIDLDRHCLLLTYTMRLFTVSRVHVMLELSWIGHSLWYLMWTQFVNYPVSYANTLLLTLQKSSIMASLFQNLINVIRYCTWSSLSFYSNTTSRSERSYPSCHSVPKILPYYPVLIGSSLATSSPSYRIQNSLKRTKSCTDHKLLLTQKNSSEHITPAAI